MSYPTQATRGHTSPFSATSEGESYLRFARVTGLLPSADMFTRVMIEDAALDSFQNVLFSITRFRELTGVYPIRITVVGHDFKRCRFKDLHRIALRWPRLRFTYEGVPLGSEADEREASEGEVCLSNFQTFYAPHLSTVASVGQRVFTILKGPVWMQRATLPKTGGTELPHADLWLSYWCPRTTRAVSGVQRMVSIFSPGRCHGRKSNLLDTSD